MSDYVSRQAVIDYLMINMNWFDEDDRMVDDWSEKLPIITDLINGVPSVVKDINVPGKWISVKAMLPEEDCDVLVYNGLGLEIAAYTTNPVPKWYGRDGHQVYAMFWRFLPEVPKEVKQDD